LSQQKNRQMSKLEQRLQKVQFAEAEKLRTECGLEFDAEGLGKEL